MSETLSKASERQVGGDHYVSLPIQPSHYIRANNLGWYEGNIIKYVTRHKQKGQIKDIEKVIHYAQLILEEYENEKQQRADDATSSDRSPDRIGATRAKFKSSRTPTSDG